MLRHFYNCKLEGALSFLLLKVGCFWILPMRANASKLRFCHTYKCALLAAVFTVRGCRQLSLQTICRWLQTDANTYNKYISQQWSIMGSFLFFRLQVPFIASNLVHSIFLTLLVTTFLAAPPLLPPQSKIAWPAVGGWCFGSCWVTLGGLCSGRWVSCPGHRHTGAWMSAVSWPSREARQIALSRQRVSQKAFGSLTITNGAKIRKGRLFLQAVEITWMCRIFSILFFI